MGHLWTWKAPEAQLTLSASYLMDSMCKIQVISQTLIVLLWARIWGNFSIKSQPYNILGFEGYINEYIIYTHCYIHGMIEKYTICLNILHD